MKLYRTSEVAQIIGIHPNTVRLYEKWKLIPPPTRNKSGYRVFTDFHIEQLKLSRIAFKIELLQGGLRKLIVQAMMLSAEQRFKEAYECLQQYHSKLLREERNAEEAIAYTKQILEKRVTIEKHHLTRKEVIDSLDITMDTLRNWERNNLLSNTEKENGICYYNEDCINRLKIIKALRCANYSLESILRLFKTLEENSKIDLKNVLNTPPADENIISVCDKLIESIKLADKNALFLLRKIKELENKYLNPPL